MILEARVKVRVAKHLEYKVTKYRLIELDIHKENTNLNMLLNCKYVT